MWSIQADRYPYLTFRQPEEWLGFEQPYDRRGWGILARINEGYPHLWFQYFDLPEEVDELGFIFKGIDSRDWKEGDEEWFIVSSINRQLLPSQREASITIPGLHGTIDFNKGDLNNRLCVMEAHILADNLTDLRKRIRKIASWLYTETFQPLIFKDEIDKQYLAKIYNAIDIQQISTNAVTNITFVCKPIAEGVAPATIVGIIAGTGQIEVTAGEEGANNGTYETRPVISLTTNTAIPTGEINLYVDGVFDFTYNIPLGQTLPNGHTLIIDCENFTVFRTDGIGSPPINELKRVEGTFPFLPAGATTTIEVTGFSGSYQVNVISKYL